MTREWTRVAAAAQVSDRETVKELVVTGTAKGVDVGRKGEFSFPCLSYLIVCDVVISFNVLTRRTQVLSFLSQSNFNMTSPRDFDYRLRFNA